MDFNQALRDFFWGPAASRPQEERSREKYQETLITGLLNLLVTKEVITKEDAQGILRDAKAAHQ